MSWHDTCDDLDSRIEASAQDPNFNDTIFLLNQPDADSPSGDQVSVNKGILALISPVFYAQFYGPLATKNEGPIEIVDGTAQGFKRFINIIRELKTYDKRQYYKLDVQNVAEVLDISYFAHKYQVWKLVVLCRLFLSEYDVEGNELDILNWAISSECGLEFKKTLPAEHALLLHNCWDVKKWNVISIFPNNSLKTTQDLPEEELMIEILGRLEQSVFWEESFMLSVALDYYCKLMEKQKILKNDSESEWNKKIVKIKTVIQLDKVYPKKLAGIYEQFLNKVPDKVICNITKEISTGWKDKDSFQSTRFFTRPQGESLYEIPFSLIDRNNDDVCNHCNTLQIKFKTNQNAIFHLDLANIVRCPRYEDDCCMEDYENWKIPEWKITFQNGDYKENNPSQDQCYFYVKENKEATVTLKRKCNRDRCALHHVRMNDFRLSKGNFVVDILEVNGQPVTSPCYSFLDMVFFTPI